MFADKLSPQAKAITAGVLVFLAQLQVVIGQGGIQEVAALTVGQWITIVLATATAYGFTYAVPNAITEKPVQ